MISPVAAWRRVWRSGGTAESSRGLVLAPTEIRTSALSTTHSVIGETQSSWASLASLK
jgi:hypothetical protein